MSAVDDHYRAMAAVHGMSVEMFDVIDCLFNGAMSAESLMEEVECPRTLIDRGVREGYISIKRDVCEVTAKGAVGFA